MSVFSRLLICHQQLVQCRAYNRRRHQPDSCISYTWIILRWEWTYPAMIKNRLFPTFGRPILYNTGMNNAAHNNLYCIQMMNHNEITFTIIVYQYWYTIWKNWLTDLVSPMNSHSKAVTAKKNNLHRVRKLSSHNHSRRKATIVCVYFWCSLNYFFFNSFVVLLLFWSNTNDIFACMCVCYYFLPFPFTRNQLYGTKGLVRPSVTRAKIADQDR